MGGASRQHAPPLPSRRACPPDSLAAAAARACASAQHDGTAPDPCVALRCRPTPHVPPL